MDDLQLKADLAEAKAEATIAGIAIKKIIKEAGSEAIIEQDWAKGASLKELEDRYEEHGTPDSTEHIFRGANGTKVDVSSPEEAKELLEMGIIHHL